MKNSESRHHQLLFIVGETIDGQLSTGTKSLGQQALKLAEQLECRAVAVLIGYRIGKSADQWSRMTRLPVVALENERCRYPNPHLAASGLESLAKEYIPLGICFPHTMRACQAAATLAWRLGSPCIAAVESVEKNAGAVVLQRSIHGGRFYATLSADRSPVVLTVMPGLFSGSTAAQPAASPPVEIRTLESGGDRFIPQSMEISAHSDQALEKARVVVAGGRGLGDAEAVSALEAVADIFQNSAVGGSRGACDLGWLPHSRQIGETGRTVAPTLYLACGISGAPQHLAGMRESQTIVAINTDNAAAILRQSHFAVIEDLRTFLPLLVERYQGKMTKGETHEDR
ncbi:electron transfer flavoprotein subunit alpha [Desulfosarcina widdelii]|uniref:Electron transfer flavoprotein subunit alpha n=1 Tax=Desulfosarcina widdelii TaxID=947919 RepID=A0A5K7ZEQ7_9BACT|nr:electron transfer flavoprotein subunit alpha/FixB family protein [Desulfosarcina widdelii]BBO74677.1 electron transfer flavoprotein subunit alpha [Desulfosarcina widdelii]